jgi:hypothetical protein
MAGGKVKPGEDGVLPNDAARDIEEKHARQSAVRRLHVQPSKEKDPPLGAKDDTGSDGLADAGAQSTQ